MRRCTPRFDVEALVDAARTPWNYIQRNMPQRRPAKRIPPTRGIEGVPLASIRDRSLSQQAASDPPTSYAPSGSGGDDGDNGDDDNEPEDPGEGTKGSSRSSAASSEELMADDNGQPSPKRSAEEVGTAETEMPSATRQRIDEGATTVEERPEKHQKASRVKSMSTSGDQWFGLKRLRNGKCLGQWHWQKPDSRTLKVKTDLQKESEELGPCTGDSTRSLTPQLPRRCRSSRRHKRLGRPPLS